MDFNEWIEQDKPVLNKFLQEQKPDKIQVVASEVLVELMDFAWNAALEEVKKKLGFLYDIHGTKVSSVTKSDIDNLKK